MEYTSVINQVVVLFLIIFVGVYAKKKNIINKEVNKSLSQLLMTITMPFMIVASFNYSFSKEMLVNVGLVLLFSFSIHGFLLVISKVIYFSFPLKTKNILRFITIFGNCAFMGFPVLQSIYGKEGVFYGSIFTIGFNVFLWTAGVMLFTDAKGDRQIKKILFNPGIVAVFIGMFLFLFSIQLPVPIYRTLELVGSLTVPLSMIIVGVILADMDLKDIFADLAVYYGAFIRLIAAPFTVFLVLKLLGMDGIVLGVCVVSAGMPAAANTALFAETYDGDRSLASKSVFITTVLSILTIPLVLLAL